MEQLKRLREERGLSQVKLAARADLNPATVNQIERGARNASTGTLRKLAAALDVSLVDLIEESDSGKADASPSQERLFNGVSEQERRALNRIKVFCDQLETAASEGKLDEPMFDTIYRVRIMDLGSLIPALYEKESIRVALRPLAIRFLDLARQLGDDAETTNVIDFAAERLERRAS